MSELQASKIASGSNRSLYFWRLFRAFSLKWRIFILFGIPVVAGIIAASFIIYNYCYDIFSKHISSNLMSIARSLAGTIDAQKLEALESDDDPYYEALKKNLQCVNAAFNLSWLAIYRYNGTYFTQIADGEGYDGDGFCYDFPILDIPEELIDAWAGKVTLLDAYEDAFGIWTSVFYPIAKADGTIVGVIDASRNMDEINRLQGDVLKRTAILVAAFALLMLALCFFAASWASRPLARLSLAAGEIARGRLGTRISDLTSGREIDMVVESFNRMSEALEQSQTSLERKLFELTALFEISKKINFAASTLDILKVILEKSIQSLNASKGSIMLFNEEQESLVVEVAFGEGIEKAEPRISLKPGEGIAGKAFAELTPKVVNSFPNDDLKPYDEDVEYDIRNILCIPLVTEGKAIGVINIVNRIEGDFDDEDVSLANTMGSQMALALEKSRMYELAITDGLTKLYVHRYFQLSMENEVKRCKRYGKKMALIIFDIDHFKKFNDTYGHQTGDIVLNTTAKLLKGTLRDNDIAARYGGEEFAVILPETDAQTAYTAAERIRKTIECHDFQGGEEPLKVTISLGISAYPEHGHERLELIKKADIALYQCKKHGRNCTTIYRDDFS